MEIAKQIGYLIAKLKCYLGFIMEMAWLGKGDSTKILHLKIDGRWLPYNSPLCRQFFVPDYEHPPVGSKGWRMFQALLKAGWKVCSTDAVNQSQELLSR